MTCIKRYIATAVAGSIGIVLLVIVALDWIAKFVDELDRLQENYTLFEALIYSALSIPSSVYEFLPLSSLVGCLVGLGMLANSNELTVIRAAGVSTLQIIWAVMRPILVFILIGFVLGEFVTPVSDQYAEAASPLRWAINWHCRVSVASGTVKATSTCISARSCRMANCWELRDCSSMMTENC